MIVKTAKSNQIKQHKSKEMNENNSCRKRRVKYCPEKKTPWYSTRNLISEKSEGFEGLPKMVTLYLFKNFSLFSDTKNCLHLF